MKRVLFPIVALVLALGLAIPMAQPVAAEEVITVDKTLERCYDSDWVLLETVTVPSNGSSVQSSNSLVNGRVYRLDASGVYYYRAEGDPNREADAEWAFWELAWTETPGHPPFPEHHLDLMVDGNGVDWGGYSPAHEYSHYYTGTGSKVQFSILDDVYGDNSGELTVKIYEQVHYECDELPLGEEIYFDMTITVHATETVTGVVVEDGIGADLVVAEVGGVTVPPLSSWAVDGKWITWSNDSVTLTRNTKGKMNATRLEWDLGDPTPCIDYDLDIVVCTGLNPQDKQEYTSSGDHYLNSGPIVYFYIDSTLHMLQGPDVMVTVVDDS